MIHAQKMDAENTGDMVILSGLSNLSCIDLLKQSAARATH